MDGKEYLEQISASVKSQAKKTTSHSFAAKLIKIILAGVVALILIIIAGSIINGMKPNIREQTVALKYHIDNTLSSANTYMTSLKSSALRSNNASLVGVLTNSSRELDGYLADKYSGVKLDNEADIKEEAKLKADELDSDLFSAKINGILDRIFARKMAYEIAAIATEANRVKDATGDQNLKIILDTMYNSLDNLYDKFNDFSEIK